jgi:hypothetical protein
VDRDRFGSCRPSPTALCSASIGSVLVYTGPAKSSTSARLFSSDPEPRGHAEPPELPCAGRRVLQKNSLGALFSELLGSTVFIRPRAQGTRAGLGAALSQEVGIRAAVTRGAPGAALRGP